MSTVTTAVANIVKTARETRDALNIRAICLADKMHHAEVALLSLDEKTAPLESILEAIAKCEEIKSDQETCEDQLFALDDLRFDMVAAICSGARSIDLTVAQQATLKSPLEMRVKNTSALAA